MRCASLALGAAASLWLALAASSPAHGATAEQPCPDTPGFVSSDERLYALAAAIKAGGPVEVLAVGSASTIGEDSGAGAAFPYHMIEALRAALPGVDFQITVKGGRGISARDQLSLLDAQLAERGYPLVLWQTGTVEAVHGTRPDTLHAILDEGIRHIRARGGDTVLIDPPFSRALRANTDTEPYERVMRQVAEMPGVVLFPRHDLMRGWMDQGELDVEKASPPDRPAVIAAQHVCLGQALAAFVLRGLNLPAP